MKVTIYTINNCGFCAQEKEYLTSKSIPFEEKNIETRREYLSEMLEKSDKFAGVPFTLIEKDDGTIVKLKGFTKEEFDGTFGQVGTATSSPVQTMEAAVQAPASNVVPETTVPEVTAPVAPVTAPPVIEKPPVESPPVVESPSSAPTPVPQPETPVVPDVSPTATVAPEPILSPLTPPSLTEARTVPDGEPKETAPVPTTSNAVTETTAPEAAGDTPPSTNKELQGVLETLETLSKNQPVSQTEPSTVPSIVPTSPPSTSQPTQSLPPIPDFPK